MLRYSEFNVLNFKAWNPDPSNSVFVCVQWVVCGWVRGGHSVHPPPFMLGGGVEPPTKFLKRAGLTGRQLLEEGFWEKGSDFFQGGCNFHIKIN